uniref:Holliday junction regulator protein family C-terminal domain-containing protein n=1 Tax=Megaselia scalaris TaxID=36166 RepID=T1H5K3_MEGSC
MSPDSPEPDSDYNLTPRTEAKYNKIDEDFQLMIARQIPNVQRGMPGQNYTLPVSVPVGGIMQTVRSYRLVPKWLMQLVLDLPARKQCILQAEC